MRREREKEGDQEREKEVKAMHKVQNIHTSIDSRATERHRYSPSLLFLLANNKTPEEAAACHH